MPLYKTIVLELLKDQYPALHERLRQERKLLEAVDRYAIKLKAAHLIWMEQLRQVNPQRGGGDIQRGPGAGDRAFAGSFALRAGDGRRRGDLLARRGDGVPESPYAARVTAARAKAGQPVLSFIHPEWRRQPTAPAASSFAADPHVPPPAPPGPDSATLQPQQPASTAIAAFTTHGFHKSDPAAVAADAAPAAT